MTDTTGRVVRVGAIDLGKIFVAVIVGAAIPVGGAMVYGWRDIAVMKTELNHINETVRELRTDVRSIQNSQQRRGVVGAANQDT